MQSLDFDLEEFHIPETICHLLKSFDFVGSFQWAGGKALEILARLCLGPTRHEMVVGLVCWIFELPTLANASVSESQYLVPYHAAMNALNDALLRVGNCR
uniref:Uncharacterized protein n=1 Tax=Candidatus Kentrum sp. TC TaxID=2126339 RepID=A0A450ZDT5_9GAMM|nr:MAG: hypothetical protein BECKTC1821D_GA0114238_11475 [Candidatus Kentron sp. TC]